MSSLTSALINHPSLPGSTGAPLLMKASLTSPATRSLFPWACCPCLSVSVKSEGWRISWVSFMAVLHFPSKLCVSQKWKLSMCSADLIRLKSHWGYSVLRWDWRVCDLSIPSHLHFFPPPLCLLLSSWTQALCGVLLHTSVNFPGRLSRAGEEPR